MAHIQYLLAMKDGNNQQGGRAIAPYFIERNIKMFDRRKELIKECKDEIKEALDSYFVNNVDELVETYIHQEDGHGYGIGCVSGEVSALQRIIDKLENEEHEADERLKSHIEKKKKRLGLE